MISMTAGAIVRAFQEYNPDEEVFIAWWDKECLLPEFIRHVDGDDTPLDAEDIEIVWAETMSNAEGMFDRDSQYVYEELGGLITDAIVQLDNDRKEI